MTTLITTRNPLETLSMNQTAPVRRRSRRINATYDEDDDGFVYTRGNQIKRAKVEQRTTIPPSPAPTTAQRTVVKRSRKDGNKDEQESAPPAKKPRGRKISLTTPTEPSDVVSVPKQRGTRKSARLSSGKGREHNITSTPQPTVSMDYDAIDLVGQDESIRSQIDNSKQSTVIALPFSDTPVANRNKELRKRQSAGGRRSSLGLRGRRASSLIDSGHSAIPHCEVESSEFYKHIQSDGLSEPRRMKQLLTWAGERALGNKPSHGDPDSAASLAARVIQEALLKDFSSKSEFSDWFSREDSVPRKVIKTPNPRNIEFEEKIAELEPRIKRLKEERNQWKALSALPPSLPDLFPKTSKKGLSASQIDTSLLDGEQAAILETLIGESKTTSMSTDARAQFSTRLKNISSTLELKIDEFAADVHRLEQYQETASRAADRVLALSAMRLEERDRVARTETRTRDLPVQEVLRSLSRILPGGNSAGSGNGR